MSFFVSAKLRKAASNALTFFSLGSQGGCALAWDSWFWGSAWKFSSSWSHLLLRFIFGSAATPVKRAHVCPSEEPASYGAKGLHNAEYQQSGLSLPTGKALLNKL